MNSITSVDYINVPLPHWNLEAFGIADGICIPETAFLFLFLFFIFVFVFFFLLSQAESFNTTAIGKGTIPLRPDHLRLQFSEPASPARDLSSSRQM